MKQTPTINISGKAYPCYMTMGAMLRFSNSTGMEVADVTPGAVVPMIKLCHCAVAAACAREGMAFDMQLDEFADRLTPDEFARWSTLLETEATPEAAGDNGEKKSA